MVSIEDCKPLWEWESEGGSPAAPRHDQAPPARRHRRPPQDTPEGCRAMAAADMARAGREAEGWSRVRLEHSAVMWSRRAKLLQAAKPR